MKEVPFDQLINQATFSREDLIRMLSADEHDSAMLFARSSEVRDAHIGRTVYFRGLIEISNVCRKNCLYCGIRSGNKNTQRYELDDEDILAAARFAYNNRFGSVVLQGGELTSPKHTERVEQLLKKIKELSNGELGVTLSLGEQDEETYRRWFEAGAHRYLLRIESSDPCLYGKIHPNDKVHDYNDRLKALERLKNTGYQVGTGVMIGLPFQTLEHLADDLLFFQSIDVDMIGMGPYIEHHDTPLYIHKDELLPIVERYKLALKMVACLRILMKDVNIAAVTALQAIKPEGREEAVKIGANIMMPNVTPGIWRNVYKLYENKPTISQNDEDNLQQLLQRLSAIGFTVGLGSWGDSKHFSERKK